MSTLNQILARAVNARLSRGPKTEEGKAASSRNSLKFGFLSRDPLLPGEDAAEWNEFRTALLASLAPVGEAQEMLAGRIVDSAWRLRRLAVVEAGIFTINLRREERDLAENAARHGAAARSAEETEEAELNELKRTARQAQEASEAPETAMGRAFMRDCNQTGAFLKLTRYEAGIERTLYRNLQALERLQAARGKRSSQGSRIREGRKLRNDLTEGSTVTDRVV